jgi:quercetin dioxygenase-like cupin family protein
MRSAKQWRLNIKEQIMKDNYGVQQVQHGRAVMDEPQKGQRHERLRAAPFERFAGASHIFDLGAVLNELREEAHSGQSGHRQMTIFSRRPVTQVLFDFASGGELANHSAHGLVMIHVLEGRLIVRADGHDHELSSGHVLILNPDVRHDVRAPVAGAMLLTVHLEDEKELI